LGGCPKFLHFGGLVIILGTIRKNSAQKSTSNRKRLIHKQIQRRMMSGNLLQQHRENKKLFGNLGV